MGTKIHFTTTFHPQTSGQVERLNQILEDMLKACVIYFGMMWEDCLPYTESHTTTAFKQAQARLHSRFYMAGSVVPRLIGKRLVSVRFLGMT